MNGKLLAAAFVAGILAATPILAQPQPQGSPAAAPATGAQPAGAQPAKEHGMPGQGMMGMGPGMMHAHMMHHMMMRREPRQWCLDRLARRAGRFTALGVRLDLTPQQQPLWDKLRTVTRDAEEKTRNLCNQLQPGHNTTALDRMNRREQFLSLRLSALQAAKPAMAALYQALTPQQRELLDHPHRHW